jgi:HlyD family secretion protein
MNAPLPPHVTAPSVPAEAERTASASAPADTAALLDEPAPRAWYRRPVLWVVAALIAIAAAGAGYWQTSRQASEAPRYTTEPARRGNITLTVTANGTLQPTRSIAIGSELSGTVSKVNVDVNDRVKKGQVLVELDTAKLKDQILRSRATLAAANAKVAQTVATVKEAQATLGRFEEVQRLSGGKVPSQTELDTARATLDRARADEAAARATVNDAQAALSTDEINLSKASIRAPSDGVILTRSVDPGNAVAASLQAVTSSRSPRI